MSKKPTITTISSGYGSTTQLNGNFSALRSAFDNTLSLDGSTPNAMSADLDLNNYDLLNANTVNTAALFIAGSRVTSVDTVFTWKGAWVTGTGYLANDTISNSGSSYICLIDHTAGATFSTDLSAGKWAVLAQQGSAGPGSGDLIAANNLSDLIDAPTALGNLGLSVTAAEINRLSGVTSAVVSVNNTQTLTNKTLTSPVLNTGVTGTAVASQAEAEAGTATDKLMTPERTTQAITALAGRVGVGQTRVDVTSSRSVSTTYQNTTGNPIFVNVLTTGLAWFQTSSNGTTWINTAYVGGNYDRQAATVIGVDEYYRMNGGTSVVSWVELR